MRRKQPADWNKWKEALDDASAAETLLSPFQNYRALRIATYNKGEALLRLKNPADADKAFQRAAQYFKDIHAVSDQADALVGRGDALTALGLKEASDFYTQAQVLRKRQE